MGVIKKYRASNAISVSVSLKNGGNARVSFTSLSDGSSVFYTEDSEIQWALEHHYKFGKLFRLEGAEPTGKEKTPAKAKKPTPKNGKGKTPKEESSDVSLQPSEGETEEPDPDEEQEEDKEPELQEVTVSDIGDAKEYLAEHFEVVRTKMKSEEIINETARQHGIIFKYL